MRLLVLLLHCSGLLAFYPDRNVLVLLWLLRLMLHVLLLPTAYYARHHDDALLGRLVHRSACPVHGRFSATVIDSLLHLLDCKHVRVLIACVEPSHRLHVVGRDLMSLGGRKVCHFHLCGLHDNLLLCLIVLGLCGRSCSLLLLLLGMCRGYLRPLPVAFVWTERFGGL